MVFRVLTYLLDLGIAVSYFVALYLGLFRMTAGRQIWGGLGQFTKTDKCMDFLGSSKVSQHRCVKINFKTCVSRCEQFCLTLHLFLTLSSTFKCQNKDY